MHNVQRVSAFVGILVEAHRPGACMYSLCYALAVFLFRGGIGYYAGVVVD